MSMENLSRGVPEAARTTQARIGCPMRGCDGTMYTMQPGEHLSRRQRPGWEKMTRECVCPACGHGQRINVLVRAR